MIFGCSLLLSYSPWELENDMCFKKIAGAAALTLFTAVLTGCIEESPREVVVYCALDKEFSQEILLQFEQETGIKVHAKFDLESNKTVGLANEIIQLADRQRCDLFWNNEILHTLRLKNNDLLVPYECDAMKHFPDQFVSPDSEWFGFAARARVLLVNKELLDDPQQWPDSIQDLVDPKWKRRCGAAKPLFGTSASHAAVIYTQLGDQAGDDFFESLAENANIESGNKQVARNVALGRYAFGLTDTDDAIIEIEAGHPVAMIFPDQATAKSGTLLIPNTLAITGGPNTDNAKQLVDFLLRKQIEERLATGPSAQIPLHEQAQIKSRVEPENLKVLKVDFEAVAENWEHVKKRLLKIYSLK